MAVPTSWYEGEHLLARLRAYDVPQSDPAWCIVQGHQWSAYAPAAEPISFEPEPVVFKPAAAYRHCVRCGDAQDYNGQFVSFKRAA